MYPINITDSEVSSLSYVTSLLRPREFKLACWLDRPIIRLYVCICDKMTFVVLVAKVELVTSADVSDGAYHQSVVTPTGNVYVACIPRNSIVVSTFWGFQLPLVLSALQK